MAAEIRPEDLRKYPHLAKLVGETKLPADNAQNAYSADDEIIPEELWQRPDAPLPVIIQHHGTDHAVKVAIAFGTAIMLTPVAIIVAVLGGMAPALIFGALIGALAMYGLMTKRKERDA